MKSESLQTYDIQLFNCNDGVDAEIMEITGPKRNGIFGIKMLYGWQTPRLWFEGTQGLADMSCNIFLAADIVCSWTFNSTNTY